MALPLVLENVRSSRPDSTNIAARRRDRSALGFPRKVPLFQFARLLHSRSDHDAVSAVRFPGYPRWNSIRTETLLSRQRLYEQKEMVIREEAKVVTLGAGQCEIRQS
jgi:hypothetical protein